MLHRRGGLEASDTYWEASTDKRLRNCNGAGTEGWRGSLVPDTIWGLNINPAADIHDWDYAEGTTVADKAAADYRFLRNMITLAKQDARRTRLKRILRPLRSHRACVYFLALIETQASIDAFHEATLK